MATFSYKVHGMGYERFWDAREVAARDGSPIFYRHVRQDGTVIYVTVPED
jgi:hypothetical protein